MAATNQDDDTAGITVSALSGPTTEAGGTATFTVVLTSQPTAAVTVGLSSSDLTEGTLSAASLTFTAATWNVAQTVTVTGVDDAVDDGDLVYSIVTAPAVSADATYNGLNPSDVSVTNTDLDTYNTINVDTISDAADGTTTSISASEVHVPGRPKDPEGVKALAVANAMKCFEDYRPGGMRVCAGSVILEPGLVERDFEELAGKGVWLAKAGFGAFATPFEYAPMIAWAE